MRVLPGLMLQAVETGKARRRGNGTQRGRR